MSTSHAPATPLPQGINEMLKDPAMRNFVRAEVEMSMDEWRAIAHAANAYPKLVTLLRSLNHMGGDERGGYCICPRNDGSAPDAKHASNCADARILLRSLGEDA